MFVYLNLYLKISEMYRNVIIRLYMLFYIALFQYIKTKTISSSEF